MERVKSNETGEFSMSSNIAMELSIIVEVEPSEFNRYIDDLAETIEDRVRELLGVVDAEVRWIEDMTELEDNDGEADTE